MIAPGNPPDLRIEFGGGIQLGRRRRPPVHALGFEETGEADRATLQSGAVGFREGILLFALDVDGPHDLSLRTVHHRYDDLRLRAAEGGEIPGVFGHVARDDGSPEATAAPLRPCVIGKRG